MMEKLDILYEDNHLIVVNKRPGQLVQGDRTGDQTLLDETKEYIKKKYNKPGDVFLGLIHRLDRPTSGIVLMARTSKALERMNKQFKERSLEKQYLAVVKNRPENIKQQLEHYLIKDAKRNKSYVKKASFPKVKQAILDYELIGSSDNYHLLKINLHTGRHHQIRAQLSAIGSPIKGDLKYGAKRSNENGSIHLHAHTIKFIHPVKKEEIIIKAKPPEENLWNHWDL